MKIVVSGKRTVEYVKPSKRELENELMDYLNTKGVHIDKDVWDETVDYILSFWDEQDYKPRDIYEAINDWYNDTKKFFPEMFGKGRKVASARYLRWIKNQKLIKSAKTKKVNKRKTADERAKDECADITCSRKPIKSSKESIENAYDVCEYCYNNLKPMYNKWFINKPNFERDYAWFVVEHTDYSVRLYIQFMDTGFVYIEGTFTNGSTYDRKTIDSWRYEQEPSNITVERIKETLDDFFNTGINTLRR